MKDYKSLYKKLLNEYMNFSTCARLHVACLLVNEGRILSCGYNGVPSGACHCTELFRSEEKNDIRKFLLRKHPAEDWKYVDETVWRTAHHIFSEKEEIHAEMNALSYALKNGINVDKCSIIASTAPCINCAKLILMAGIKEVYYVDLYDRNSDGIEFLLKNNVNVKKL